MSHESKSNVPLLDFIRAQPVNNPGATRPEWDADKGQPGEAKLPEWMLLHIPHDSTSIPSSVRGQFLLDDAGLNAELLRMTDHWTFDLFGHGVPAHQIIRAAVSRLVVDVERFDDDSQEVMAARGMGAVYQHSAHGFALRRLLRPEERESLLNSWYWPHHKRLELAVEKALTAYGHALVVDAHSFPSCPLPYELDQRPDRPDICIGTDSFHTPRGLEEAFVTAFRRAGFSVSVNFPFSGALVPKRHYGQDKRVASVMIEINRGLYMDEISGRRLDRFTSVASALHRCIDYAISLVNKDSTRSSGREEHSGELMQQKKSTNFDPKAMRALTEQMLRDGTMPPIEQLEAALERIRKEHAAKILKAREQDQRENK